MCSLISKEALMLSGDSKSLISQSNLMNSTIPVAHCLTIHTRISLMQPSSQNPNHKSTFLLPHIAMPSQINFPHLSPLPSLSRGRSEDISKRVKHDADGVEHMGRWHLSAGSLNTATPCAACKLLRRRCAQECPFSPYFSPHEPQKFASVHKVFGASNVSKLLLEVPESQRADAANSLVFEANMRLRDPVYGCMGTISALQQQVQILGAELEVVRGAILKMKYRQTTATVLPTSHVALLARDGIVSVAAPPPLVQANHGAPPAVPSTSSSSLYTHPSACSTDYSSVTNENVPYFA